MNSERPSTRASPAKRVRQRSSLRTTTRSALSSASCGANSRPSTGRAPSAASSDGDTSAPTSRRSSSSMRTVVSYVPYPPSTSIVRGRSSHAKYVRSADPAVAGRRAPAEVLLPHAYEPIGCRVWQRSQQNAVDDRKHRGRRTDAQRQREQRRNGEAGTTPPHASRVAHILAEVREPAQHHSHRSAA